MISGILPFNYLAVSLGHLPRRRTPIQQSTFTDDGGLEPTEESVATSLEGFGADVSHREVETRLGWPAASEFGVDDRVEVRYSKVDDTDQASLFADTADDQQTLTGEDASAQFLFAALGENND